MSKRPMLLCIMDGFGRNESDFGNAIHAAAHPNLTRLFAENPLTFIGASGMDVGLPAGQMGNSEVGHTNIGAGRVVYQPLTKITKFIEDGVFFENPRLLAAIENCKAHNSALHIFGLLSDGGVHSHNTHMYAILEMAKRCGLDEVYLHCFLDGRDVPPASGADYIAEAEDKMREIGVGKVATVMGRYYAMDRDNRWERVGKAYAAMVYGEGEQVSDPVQAVRDSYTQLDEEGKYLTDEFVLPKVCSGARQIDANDSIIFYNFRPDRAREITRSFVDPDFTGFERRKGFFPVHYVCMSQYDATMPNVSVAYTPEDFETVLHNTFGEYMAACGKTQLRIAETEKYAHVTFFFNGGVETTFAGEDRILVPSPKVATYDLQPEMSAYPVAEKVVEAVESDKYDAIILNFANCDMVGHTGVFEAAVKAVEAVDACVGKVVDAVLGKGGAVIITADHGNADKMLEEDGVTPFTAHTTNPVPFCVVGYPCTLREGGRLCDIAPTMLQIMELPQPAEMSGKSLIAD